MNVTPTSTFQPNAGIEIIPGYVLREKVGAGGFGEVWRVDAPGGLTKAIKFICGLADDSRAAREREALERIKELRHPFLLSTERVEVVDGTLVIVLEYAEGNLRERFDECLRRGLRGLPADELINQLRDAADALDYLWNSESLQHLDVKPENLMLSGGRIKVGDFGLLRQVDDDSATAGGITPAYAAPEVFDGRPTRTSDQYSLAIVYQELLTGQLPFRGRTAAQLAMQHAHQPPAVDPLPIEQRSVVKRALAKEPTERFQSCRAFIDALIAAQQDRPRFAARGRSSADQRVRQFIERDTDCDRENSPDIGEFACNTEPLKHDSTNVHTELIADSQDLVAAHHTSQPIYNSVGLGPLEVTNQERSPHRPIFVIGLGGVGIDVVCRLKQAISSHLGKEFDPYAFQFLGIDTAEESLQQAACGTSGAILDGSHETLRIPLRPAREYREGGIQRFGSMDRRWVFNVPRSLRTERMRPFARLAFVDHYERIKTTIDFCLQRLAKHNDDPKMESQELSPAVYVVGSICGATCGGIANELGYLLRNRLHAHQISDVDLVGLFTSELPSDETTADLSAANGMAFLTELEAYSNRIDGYRGEIAAGIPGSGHQQGPFDQSLFVHFGMEGSPADESGIVGDLSSFLMLNALSPSCYYFARSYQAEAAGHSQAADCRMVARVSSGVACLVSPQVKGRLLANELIKRWTEYAPSEYETEKHNRQEIESWTRKSIGRLGADTKELVDWIGEQLLQRLGLTREKMISRCTRRAVQQTLTLSHQASGREMIERMLQVIDQSLGKQMTNQQGEGLPELIGDFTNPLIETATAQFDEWIKTLVDTVGVRCRGAHFAIEFCDELLRNSASEASHRRSQRIQRIVTCRDSIVTELVLLNKQAPQEPISDNRVDGEESGADHVENPLVRLSRQLEQYAELRFSEWCMRIAESLINTMLDRVLTVRLWHEKLEDRLARLEKRLEIRSASDHQDDKEKQHGSLVDLAPSLAESLEQLVRLLDEAVAVDAGPTGLSLLQLVDAEGAELDAIEQTIDQTALQVLTEFEAKIAADASESDQEGESELDSIEQAMRRVAPPHSLQGAAHRVMVLSPGKSEEVQLGERVAKLAGALPTLLSHPALNVEFVSESLNVKSVDLAKALYANKERRLELAERLRTRIDL